MVLVDSSVWIEAGRPNGDLLCKVALEALLEVYEAALCSPVKLEVLGGVRATERRFLEEDFAVIPYVAASEQHWTRALRLGWCLRDLGHTVKNNDLLIAAIALETGCRVYARDEHFDLMAEYAGLSLYRPGCGGSYEPGDE
jgi:predicted nucleic acid-binding protein